MTKKRNLNFPLMHCNSGINQSEFQDSELLQHRIKDRFFRHGWSRITNKEHLL